MGGQQLALRGAHWKLQTVKTLYLDCLLGVYCLFTGGPCVSRVEVAPRLSFVRRADEWVGAFRARDMGTC